MSFYVRTTATGQQWFTVRPTGMALPVLEDIKRSSDESLKVSRCKEVSEGECASRAAREIRGNNSGEGK